MRNTSIIELKQSNYGKSKQSEIQNCKIKDNFLSFLGLKVF